jgi:hypothetical protein
MMSKEILIYKRVFQRLTVSQNLQILCMLSIRMFKLMR